MPEAGMVPVPLHSLPYQLSLGRSPHFPTELPRDTPAP